MSEEIGYYISPFECYQYYVSIKLHFNNEDYSFPKYGPRAVKESGYAKRKDKYFFEVLSKKYTRKQFIPFLVSNFLKNNNVWVGDLASKDNESHEVYLDFVNKRSAMMVHFKEDLDNIVEFCTDKQIDVEDLFVIKNGQHPIIFKFYLQELINLNTFVVLNDIINFFPIMNKKLESDIIWNDIHRIKLTKYKSFLLYNKERYKDVVKEKLI